MDIKEELKNNSKKFNRVVIWGLKNRWHTHRFIFQAYYQVFKKCGIPVVWVEDEKKNQKIIKKGDLIFTASGMTGKMVPEKISLTDYNVPIRDDVYYCLHAEKDIFIQKIKADKRIELKYYSDESEKYPKIYEVVHFDSASRTLYQPWGTNLLPEEFKKPIFNKNKFIFWVGSIWNDKNNHGNIEEVTKFKNILAKKKLNFIHLRFIPDFLNIFFIRKSRIAPAIAGRHQVEINYLPCRMFKNISYGQLGFSNIKKFNDIFRNYNIYDEDIEIMTDRVLLLSKDEYIEMIKKQQEICKRYTIAHHLNNIFKIFNTDK
jgi:hypothetical protein